MNLSYKDAASMRMGILNFKLINNPTTPKNKIELLLESYFENTSDYKYYDSIFGFVTGANDFNIESFVAEFKSNYRLESGKVLPEYQQLYELDFFNALKLSDEEYKRKTLQILEYAKNGKYLLMEYLQVYFYCERFNNPLGLDLNQLGKDLKNAMTLAAKNPEYLQKDTTSKLNLKHQNGYDDLQEEIKLHGLQILEKHSIEKEKESEQNIIALFLNNLDDLYNKYHEDEKFKRTIIGFPLFKLLDIDKFFKRLIELSPFSINFLIAFFKGRYSIIKYEDEAAFVTAINRKLCDYLNEHKERTRRIWALNEFQKELNSIENKYGLPVIV